MEMWTSAKSPPCEDGEYGVWITCYATPGGFDNPFGEVGWYQGDAEYRGGKWVRMHHGKLAEIGGPNAEVTHWMPRWLGEGKPQEPLELLAERVAEKRTELAELEARLTP